MIFCLMIPGCHLSIIRSFSCLLLFRFHGVFLFLLAKKCLRIALFVRSPSKVNLEFFASCFTSPLGERKVFEPYSKKEALDFGKKWPLFLQRLADKVVPSVSSSPVDKGSKTNYRRNFDFYSSSSI